MTRFFNPQSAVHNPQWQRLALAAVLLAAPLACKSNSSGSATNSATVAAPLPANETGARRRTAPSNTDLVLKQGKPPIRYLIAASSVIRVNDITSDRQLLRKPVPNNTIVLIDAAQGVKVGDAVLVKGPLNRDHQYELIVERLTNP